jgi:hypothetical protein
MSFFEPLPPPPPESARQWSPPAWDRPSEGTVPAIVPVGEIVHRSDDVVVELEHIRAYPNGFTINGYRFSVWVFPLPPDGPIEVYVSLPAAAAPESRVVLDGAVVRSAAERARVIWR